MRALRTRATATESWESVMPREPAPLLRFEFDPEEPAPRAARHAKPRSIKEALIRWLDEQL